MKAAAAELDYERAARLRDDIGALERALEKNAVVLGDGTDADVLALHEDPLEVAVQIFSVRGGRIRGQRGWVADKVDDAGTGDLVERAVVQLYDGEPGRRDPAPGAGADAARRRDRHSRSGCSALRGGRVAIRVPQRGDKRALMETVERNAEPEPGPAQDPPGQRPDHPQPGAGGDPARRCGSTPRRCGSSATTSPTCRAPRWSRRWWCSRTACPARASTAGS